MIRHTVTTTALLFAFLLSACGQSGPLYLPGNPSQVKEPPAPPAQPGEDETADDDENEDAHGATSRP